MKNKPKKPGAQTPDEVYQHALHVKEVLVNQGKTFVAEYPWLLHYIDSYERGIKNIAVKLAGSIDKILNNEETSAYFFQDTKQQAGNVTEPAPAQEKNSGSSNGDDKTSENEPGS